MRKLATASLLAVALLLIHAAPSDAGGRRHHGHSRVFVGLGFGPAYWYGPYPYWYYPPPYYYYPPPSVVVQEPPVYVQQQQPAAAAPAPPSAPAEGYWHYCPSARDYYPKVQACPEGWIKVPPRQE